MSRPIDPALLKALSDAGADIEEDALRKQEVFSIDEMKEVVSTMSETGLGNAFNIGALRVARILKTFGGWHSTCVGRSFCLCISLLCDSPVSSPFRFFTPRLVWVVRGLHSLHPLPSLPRSVVLRVRFFVCDLNRLDLAGPAPELSATPPGYGPFWVASSRVYVFL